MRESLPQKHVCCSAASSAWLRLSKKEAENAAKAPQRVSRIGWALLKRACQGL